MLASPVCLPTQLLEPWTEVASDNMRLDTLHVKLRLGHELGIPGEEGSNTLFECTILPCANIEVEGDGWRYRLQLVVEDMEVARVWTIDMDRLNRCMQVQSGLAAMLGALVLVS